GGESGVEADGGSGGRDRDQGVAWGVRQGVNFDASKVEGGVEDDCALLVDELKYSQLYPDRAVGQGGKGSKSQAKTLIVGDEGFKPSKPLVVEEGAVVSMKAACVGRNARVGHACVLTISLEIPVPRHATPQRYFDSFPSETTLVKSNAPGGALLAVFHRPGEYWLIDHFSRKRLKVTVTETPKGLPQTSGAATKRGLSSAAPVKHGGVEPADECGGLGRSSESRNSAEDNVTGWDASTSSSSRPKKKSKSKGNASAAAVAAKSSTTAAAVATAATTTGTHATDVAADSTVAAPKW
ncbi:unnamed protein product, partial [Scytosiphon promiscuus]